MASTTFWPCETRTSTCRSFATISSGLYRFLAITVLLDVKDIPQVGPVQWGWITMSSRFLPVGPRSYEMISKLSRQTVLRDSSGGSPLRGRKAPIKFRDRAGNTWAGRGAQPRWLREKLKA